MRVALGRGRVGQVGFPVVIAVAVAGTFGLAFPSAKADSQTTAPATAMGDALVTHLHGERFSPLTTVAALPASGGPQRRRRCGSCSAAATSRWPIPGRRSRRRT